MPRKIEGLKAGKSKKLILSQKPLERSTIYANPLRTVELPILKIINVWYLRFWWYVTATKAK